MGIAFPGDMKEKVELIREPPPPPYKPRWVGILMAKPFAPGSRGERGPGYWLLFEDWCGPKKRPGVLGVDYIWTKGT